MCVQSRHNMSAPDWVTADVMEKLKVLKDFGFQVMVVGKSVLVSVRSSGSSCEDKSECFNGY